MQKLAQRKKFIGMFIAMVLYWSMVPAFAQSVTDPPTMTVKSVTAQAGEIVTVPIILSNNTGICGITLGLNYDSNLVLTGVQRGEAVGSLNFTGPKNLSTNPTTLLWDGLDADYTDGLMVTLTFIAPEKAGNYGVSIFYQGSDIVDGEIQPVYVKLIQGTITVTSKGQDIIVEVGEKSVTLTNESGNGGIVLVAFYGENGELIKLCQHSPSESKITVPVVENATYTKVFWWESTKTLRPVCKAEKIDLNI